MTQKAKPYALTQQRLALLELQQAELAQNLMILFSNFETLHGLYRDWLTKNSDK